MRQFACMRIAMVSEHASPLAAPGVVDAGEQHVHVAELSAALAARGHEVTVYTRRDAADLPDRLTAPAGYQVVHVPAGPAEHLPTDALPPHMNAFANFLHTRWRTERPDVVHSHFWLSGLAATLVGRQLGVPVVHTYHGLGAVRRRHVGGAETGPPERTGIETAVGRAATRIVATCSDEVFELLRIGVSREKVSVVPCGVDVERFSPDGPRAPTTAPYRIVSVGRLVPHKGFADLIEVLPALPGAELVIAGGETGPEAEAARLRALAARAGVSDRVSLPGPLSRADLPALLRSADIAACVPRYASCGIVPLEAMACGVPVVATAIGGLTDTVVDGVTGVHVPQGNRQALAKTLHGLLTHPARRAELGAAGRDRATSRYPWSRVAADTVRAYQRARPGAAEDGDYLVGEGR